MNRPHPVSGSIPAAGDHLAWAGWWGERAIISLRKIAVQELLSLGPEDDAQIRLNIDFAVQAGRLAWWHACRAKYYPYWDVVRRDELCR